MPHILYLTIGTVTTVTLAWALITLILVGVDVLTHQPAEAGEQR